MKYLTQFCTVLLTVDAMFLSLEFFKLFLQNKWPLWCTQDNSGVEFWLGFLDCFEWLDILVTFLFLNRRTECKLQYSMLLFFNHCAIYFFNAHLNISLKAILNNHSVKSSANSLHCNFDFFITMPDDIAMRIKTLPLHISFTNGLDVQVSYYLRLNTHLVWYNLSQYNCTMKWSIN